MDPKEFLKQYELAVCRIEIFSKELELAQEEYNGIPLTRLQNIRYQTVTFNLKRTLHKYIQYCRAEIEKNETIKKEIETAIGSVEDPTQRKLLTMRYIDGLTWDEIAGQLYYSMEWAHQIHHKALDYISSESCA